MTAAPSIWAPTPAGLTNRAAIDGNIDPRHSDCALAVNRDLPDGRDVADEAPMDSEATTGVVEAVAKVIFARPPNLHRGVAATMGPLSDATVFLRKSSRAPGRAWPREVRRSRHHLPEEQDHPPLDQAQRAPERCQRPASRLRLYLWRDLPQGGRSPRYAEMQHRSHEPTPGRKRHPGRAGRARCAAQKLSTG